MRAEAVPSATVAASRQPSTASSADLPYWIPGVGAWPGHVVSMPPPDGRSAVTSMWCYTAPGPNASGIRGMKPTAGLVRVVEADAAHILEALQSPAAALPARTTWTQRGRALLQKVQTGAPLEVAEAVSELRSAGRSRVLSFSEKRLLDTARRLVRSVLDALPDSPARRRALEILDDRDRKPPCPR